MNLGSKISHLLLFVDVEFALVYAVSHNILAKLSAEKLVKNHAVFSSVDYITVVECFEFFKEL